MDWLEQFAERLSKLDLDIEEGVILWDIKELRSALHTDEQRFQFFDRLLTVLEQIAQDEIPGKKLSGVLSDYCSVYWSSGLPSHLEKDMRTIYGHRGGRRKILAIGFRRPESPSADIYTRAVQRVRSLIRL